MRFNSMVPELTVMDINKTREFYIDILGFKLEYERVEDKFIFLSYGESQFMFEEFHQDGWNLEGLSYPFGNGVNFSIETDDIESLYKVVKNLEIKLYRELKIVNYRVGGIEVSDKEFLIQDPDGYLLRFVQEG